MSGWCRRGPVILVAVILAAGVYSFVAAHAPALPPGALAVTGPGCHYLNMPNSPGVFLGMDGSGLLCTAGHMIPAREDERGNYFRLSGPAATAAAAHAREALRQLQRSLQEKPN